MSDQRAAEKKLQVINSSSKEMMQLGLGDNVEGSEETGSCYRA